MTRLSIIIPVYLTEDYNLKNFQTLLSELLYQKIDYPETEIICVDDGSPIKPEYPEGICVIHQENKGISGARNTGIDAATGEWITFLDDDDFITPEYLQTIYRYLREKFEYISFDWVFNNGRPSQRYEPGYRNNVVWAYVFRRDVIGTKRFDTSRDYDGDIDFVKKTINPNRLHKDISDVLVIYFWFGNVNSYAHRHLRGEI